MPSRKNEAVWIDSAGRWQINVQRNGQRKTFTCTTPTKKGKIEAERKADRWLSTMSDDNISLHDAWEIFIADKSEVTGTPNCMKLNSIYYTWFEPSLGKKRISSITCQDWQKIVNAAAKAGRSRRTCANIRAAATTFYAFARKSRWEMEKPEFIDIPKTAKAGVRNIVQPSDLAVLFSEDTIIDRGSKKFVYYIYAYRFIVILGLRRGELAGIMHSDINDNVLHIRRSVNPLGEITGGKTENAARKIYLPELARKILSDQAKMLKEYDIESDYVFPSPSGEIMDTNSLYQHWRSYRRQHNINSSLHELRHTMISVMKADMPEQLLKSVVGHSDSMDTFGVYGHEVDGDLERAAQVIDDVYGKIIKM